jgi:adenine deaminase
MLSSCVPASHLESRCAELKAVDLLPFLSDPWVRGLAEMMNYPGVLSKDPDGTWTKSAFVGRRRSTGTHRGLSGMEPVWYIAAGIRKRHTSLDL